MTGYYSTVLAGERLKTMYGSAPARIQQYLQAEVDHIRTLLSPDDEVLELGCGYGRVMKQIADCCRTLTGIDNSIESLQLGSHYLRGLDNCQLLEMDATTTAFEDNTFDAVICLQNGISAFHVEHQLLFREALRIAGANGLVVFSTYTDSFWDERLKWFEQQARDGYIGPIDYERTANGKIVCTDGFSATTVSIRGFRDLGRGAGVEVELYEVDASSLFCLIQKGT